MNSGNKFKTAFTRFNISGLSGNKITSFIIVFTFVFLSVLLRLSLTFAQSDIAPPDSDIREDNTTPIFTHMAPRDSFPQKERIERLFAEKTDHEDVTIRVLKDEDIDQSHVAQSDSVDEVKFYIHVTNNTAEKLPLLKIPTGIQEGTLNYIRVEGATGYVWEEGGLVLAYVSLLPGASTTVTVTGLPLISPDPVSLDITPTVQNFSSQVISRGKGTTKLIGGKNFSLTNKFNMGRAQAGNNQEVRQSTDPIPASPEPSE